MGDPKAIANRFNGYLIKIPERLASTFHETVVSPYAFLTNRQLNTSILFTTTIKAISDTTDQLKNINLLVLTTSAWVL